MFLTLIAAYDDQGGIGYQGKLPWHLPADLAFFRQQTLGKAILMGRKTFESIGRPLPGRRNIVMTRQDIAISGVEIVHDLATVLAMDVKEVMVIGGAELYQLCLPFTSKLILTEVHTRVLADTFFPVLSSDYVCTFEEYRPSDSENCYDLTFREFAKRN